MAATHVIKCRVPEGLKRRFEQHASSLNVRPSAALRTMIYEVLAASTADELDEQRVQQTERSQRLTVRLGRGDGALLATRARNRGMTLPAYVRTLCRSHVRGVYRVPDAELLEVRQLLSRIAAIAELLRAIAALEQPLDHATIAQAVEAVSQARRAIADLVRKNAESWDA